MEPGMVHKADTRNPKRPQREKLENKAMPKHTDDARVETTAYPAGTAPRESR